MQIPIITRPTSVYDILDIIKGIALEEPKRINMGYELRVKKGLLDPDAVDNSFLKSQGSPHSQGWPSCGTVGCVAGWGWVVSGYPRTSYPEIGHLAAEWGLTYSQSDELFFPESGPIKWNAGWFDEGSNSAGTPEYAQHVVNHISAFQRQYERQLRDKMVAPVGSGGQ